MNVFTLTGEYVIKGEDKVLKSLDNVDKKASGVGGAFGKVGKAAGIGMAAAAGAAVAAGGALLKVGNDFDQAYNTIRIGTGATGEAFEEMQGVLKNVASTTVGNLDDMGYAVAELNTRLGLTGEPLEKMSTQMVNLARITGDDINSLIPATTRLFGDWGIATKDQSETLDYLMRVSQNTGIGVTELSEKMVTSGASLRQMGFSFEEATMLLGRFEKEGVNTETMLSSLKIGLNKMAKEGITDANEALNLLMQEVKEAPSDLEAVSIAAEVFGSRAAADMAAAIREGRFDLEEMQKAMAGSTDTINDLAEETMTLGERFELFKNQIFVAIEPLAKNLMDAFKDIIDVIGTAVVPKIADLVTAFTPLIDKIVELIPVLIDGLMPAFIEIADAVIPLVTDIFSILIDDILPPVLELFTELATKVLPPLMRVIGSLVSTILPPLVEIFSRLIGMILPPLVRFFGMLIDTILPPFVDIVELIVKTLEPFLDILMSLLEAVLPPLIDIITTLVESILPPFLDIITLLIDYALMPLVEVFGKLIEWALPLLTEAIGFLTETVIPAVIGIFTNWQGVVDNFRQFFEGFATRLREIWSGIAEFFGTVWDNMLEKFEGFKEGFLRIWDGIKDGIKFAINAIIGFINGMITGIETGTNFVIKALNRIQIDIPEWVPVFGGSKFGLNLKELSLGRIPTLAEGGYISGAGYALVGEAGPEMVYLPSGATVSPLGGKLDVSGRIEIALSGAGAEHLDSNLLAEVITTRLIDTLKQEGARK